MSAQQSSLLISTEDFSRSIENIGFFEANPTIAIGISGGMDSMALVLLAHDWAQSEGGKVIGLTVDHGLRDGSQEEAVWVAQQLSYIGIAHHILAWQGEKPLSALQEKARRIRRALMLSWCRSNGVLHLGLAHHACDQVETHLMRLSRSNSIVGLAGMSLIREPACARIIRPLLSYEKERLKATLLARGQTWLEDPSNKQTRFERVRIRKLISEMAKGGGDLQRIRQSVCEYGSQRLELEQQGAQVLAGLIELYPAGYARINFRTLKTLDKVLLRFTLSRIIMVVGGQRYPVSYSKIDRAHSILFRNRRVCKLTLGGCMFVRNDNSLLVVREERNLPLAQVVKGGKTVHWDNRFFLRADGPEVSDGVEEEISPLGRQGWNLLVQSNPELRDHSVPLIARYALPALYQNGKIIAVAHLTNYYTKDHPRHQSFEKARFFPCEPLIGEMFSVALLGFCTISEAEGSMLAEDERIIV